MKTLAEVQTWLKTPSHIRVVLVKVGGVGNSPSPTFYLSSKPFVSSNNETLANQVFDPCLIGGVSFNGQLSLDGSAQVGFGDIEIENTGGVKDAWLNYIWTNKPIEIYIGDPSWKFEDFYKIFTGLVADINARSLSSLNLVLVDKSQKLNNPISEQVLANQPADSEVLVPLTFGECFNVTPVATNESPNTLTYQVHNGPIEDIIEARDNGAPIQITKDLAAGKFSLSQSLYGQLTCSVQGHKPAGGYKNDAPGLIKYIVTQYGPANSRLVDADIDLDSFNIVTSSQPVGVYCTSRENVYDICSQLAASIGYRLVFTDSGKLKLVKMDLPDPNTSTFITITESDIEDSSLVIDSKLEVKATTKLAYCKNYTPQTTGLAAGLPQSSQSILANEWMYYTKTNSTSLTQYNLDEEPEQEDTLLIDRTGAQLEADRRNAIVSQARFIYSFTAYAHHLFINLGDTVKVYNSRYGLESGKLGTVVSVDKDWISGRIKVGVLM